MTFSSAQWQSLASFLEALAFASVPGILIYVFIRFLCEKSPQQFLFVFAFVAAFIVYFGLVALGDKIVFIAASLLVCIGATFTDRAAQPSEERWFETLFKIAVSTLCSAFASFLPWLYLAGSVSQGTVFSGQEEWFSNGFLVGSLVAPPAISIFFWVWNLSKLRPGIDRHLRQGDEAQ